MRLHLRTWSIQPGILELGLFFRAVPNGDKMLALCISQSLVVRAAPLPHPRRVRQFPIPKGNFR